MLLYFLKAWLCFCDFLDSLHIMIEVMSTLSGTRILSVGQGVDWKQSPSSAQLLEADWRDIHKKQQLIVDKLS